MHELRPLCGCKVNGEGCEQAQYVNIGKWTPRALPRRRQTLRPALVRRAAENLSKREGASSQWSKERANK